MAWTDLSGAFGYGTKLTSAQQGQLRDNVTHVYDFCSNCSLTDGCLLLGDGTSPIKAAAARLTAGQVMIGQSTGDPLTKTLYNHITCNADGGVHVTGMDDLIVVTNHIHDTTISEAKMANSSISQSKLKTSYAEVNVTIPGASDGSTGTLPGGEYGFAALFKANNSQVDFNNYWRESLSTSYTASQAHFYNNGSPSYVGYAQVRYVTSSGEVFWIFVLRDKKTKATIAMYQAPDHPCFGLGGNPLLVPHPFTNMYDPEIHEIIVINPDYKDVEAMQDEGITEDTEPDKSLLEIIETEYEIDEVSKPDWPETPVTVGLPNGRDWKREPDGTPVIPIKKVIPRPDGVICKSLIKKQGK